MSARVFDYKCWPEFFAAIVDGSKPFDARIDDRKLIDTPRVGSLIIFHEWSPHHRDYIGRTFCAQVTYVLRGREPIVPPGWVIFGLRGLGGEGRAVPTPLQQLERLSNDGRCPSEMFGHRCICDQGHAGTHLDAGYTSWDR